MKKLLVLIFLVGIVLGAGCVFWYLQLQPVDSNQTKVIFELHHGAFKKIAQELQQKGIIKSARAFTLYARAMRAVKDVKMGEYELSSSQSAKEVLSAITSGTSITYDVTFQEGLSMFEIAQILASKKLINEKKFLDLCKDKTFVHSVLGVDRPSLEGYLFPETYKLTKFTGEEEILKTMVAKFKGVISEIQPELWNKKEELHKIIILASIIEKETGADFERSKVASVFYNRIQKKMRLQSDPTIMYGQKYDMGIDLFNIKKDDILKPTRFNTYTVDGLPLGPISNPGKLAILATLTPDKTNFLYFVSFNDGTHFFSKSYKEHQKAVMKYQVNKKNREGKSWRDLKKAKPTEQSKH